MDLKAVISLKHSPQGSPEKNREKNNYVHKAQIARSQRDDNKGKTSPRTSPVNHTEDESPMKLQKAGGKLVNGDVNMNRKKSSLPPLKVRDNKVAPKDSDNLQIEDNSAKTGNIDTCKQYSNGSVKGAKDEDIKMCRKDDVTVSDSKSKADNQNGSEKVVSTKNWSEKVVNLNLILDTKTDISGTNVKPHSKWVALRNTVKVANSLVNVKKRKVQRQDSFLAKFSTRQTHDQLVDSGSDAYTVSDITDCEENVINNEKKKKKKKRKKLIIIDDPLKFVVNREGNGMFYWLAIVTLAFLYNIWTLIAREAFPLLQDGYNSIWFTLDYIMDAIYLADIIVQLRTGYLQQGIVVHNWKKLAKNYVKSKYFVLDLLTLLPLDLLQIWIGIHPLIRFPRFIKLYRAYDFTYMVESRTPWPNLWRVVNLCHILFVSCHWFAGFFIMISKEHNYAGDWTYPEPVGDYASLTRMYLRSLHWATLTLTAIGDLPPPEQNWEYVFTIASYLIGVFVFATVVGQVGSVITNRNAARLEFERLLDGAKSYMRNHDVPKEMQTRVQRWYDYTWSRGRMAGQGGGDINTLGLLPDKLKTELALHVNLDTLKKVTIFNECEPEFLHDLVLKMKAYIFTPGDLVCRRGEVAREMYIIADGMVEVLSDTGDVIVTLGTGGFFGEIGILKLDGVVNRRTADVRSVGYSELICLARNDVLSALKDYPQAEVVLTKHAQQRLEQIKKIHSDSVECDTTPPEEVVQQRKASALPSSCTDMFGFPTSPHNSHLQLKSNPEVRIEMQTIPSFNSSKRASSPLPQSSTNANNILLKPNMTGAQRTLSALSMIDGINPKAVALPVVAVPSTPMSIKKISENETLLDVKQRLQRVEEAVTGIQVSLMAKLDILCEKQESNMREAYGQNIKREIEMKQLTAKVQQLLNSVVIGNEKQISPSSSPVKHTSCSNDDCDTDKEIRK